MSMLKRAILFATSVGVLGYIVSSPVVLDFLVTQSPVVDFVAWYGLLIAWSAVVYAILFSRLIPLRIGAAVVLFDFGLGTTLYWAASGAALTNAGIPSNNVPSFLLASEDGV